MVNPVASSIPPPSTSAEPPRQELGRDAFVKLLMTQLQSQDPTAPQSSEAFVAQLAQFTSVELLERQNANLESLLVAQASSNQTAVASLVGRDVAFVADTMKLEREGQEKDLRISLPAQVDTLVVSVVDASGKTVRTIHLGAQDAGERDLHFDGRADDGTPLPAGEYELKIAATADGQPVEARVMQRGSVTGVSFANGIAELIIDGLKIRLADVVEVHERVGH